MPTVVSRCFRSSPYRDTGQTWQKIVDLLAGSKESENRTMLLAVAGIASSIIADQSTLNAPIVVSGDGPRVRIYCVFDDDALDESLANEEGLGFDPLKEGWSISLPCNADDLPWVQDALLKIGTRIEARDASTGFYVDERAEHGSDETLVLDPKGFLGK